MDNIRYLLGEKFFRVLEIIVFIIELMCIVIYDRIGEYLYIVVKRIFIES